jgi:hypothetical protein
VQASLRGLVRVWRCLRQDFETSAAIAECRTSACAETP